MKEDLIAGQTEYTRLGAMCFRDLHQAITVQGHVVGKQNCRSITGHIHVRNSNSLALSPRTCLQTARPDKYDGDPTKCQGFLLQCSLYSILFLRISQDCTVS